MAPRRTRAKPVVFGSDYALDVTAAVDSAPSLPCPPSPPAAPLPPAVEARADSVSTFTPAQLAALSARQVTELLNRQARAVLGERRVATRTTLPFTGSLDNNPFVYALTQKVPSDICTPRNVFLQGGNGATVFRPWFWRLTMTRALNVYLCDYMCANPRGPPFPLQELKRQRRQHKNRGYQRNTRQRRAGENK